MLRAQSSCREVQGKESAEFFHYGISAQEIGFWRGYSYVINSKELSTPD
jgi:hypothetical protein